MTERILRLLNNTHVAIMISVDGEDGKSATVYLMKGKYERKFTWNFTGIYNPISFNDSHFLYTQIEDFAQDVERKEVPNGSGISECATDRRSH